jgi:hypothetical protein
MPGRFGREEQLLADHAGQLGIPVIAASEKMMERGRVDLDRSCLVAGTVPFVSHALRRLGLTVPEHNPYPATLAPWLHRKVWRADRLRDVIRELDKGGPRVFVKPANGWKRFPGFVVEFGSDHRFNGASKNTPVWVSEPVEFVSEWRAYVAHGVILDICFADHGGDRLVTPDTKSIHDAVARLVSNKFAPAGFVIDFGVTKAGVTALVEMNDGFSFGAYDGVSADVYWKVTAARWFELLSA